MPLSEHEERILQEMERRYHASDPDSYRRIRTTTLGRYLVSNLRWSALGFALGLAVLLTSFVTSWLLAVCGFVVMLASAVAFTQNLRRMGRHGIEQLRTSVRARNVGGSVDEARKRLRRRFGDDR